MAKKRDEAPRVPVVLAKDVARAKEALTDRIRLGKELADRHVTHGATSSALRRTLKLGPLTP